MLVKVPYNCLILHALLNLIKYEGKRSISVPNLNNYINAILEKALSIYQNSDYTYKTNIDDWHGNVKFVYDKDYLTKFITTYNIVSLDNNIIVLKDNITYEYIEDLINEVMAKEKVSNRFLTPTEYLPFLKLLGIEKIPRVVANFLHQEQQIENFYYSSNHDDRIMALNSLKRIMFLNNLSQKEDYTLLAYQNVFCEMLLSNDESINFFPVNYEKYINSPYGKDENGDIYHLSKLHDGFHKAIFGNFPLFYEKSLMMVEDVLASCLVLDSSTEDLTEIDDMDLDIIESEAFFDQEKIKFYTMYIEKLTSYIEQFLIYLNISEQEELLQVKKRLIYIFDDPNITLLNEEALNEFIMEASIPDTDVSYTEFANEIYYYITDIFTEKQTHSNIIKKILYISTYYELTLDDQIINLLNGYYLNKNYETFCNLIFDGDYPPKLKRNK